MALKILALPRLVSPPLLFWEFLERPPFPTSDMMKGVYIMISKEVLEKFWILNSCRLLIPESWLEAWKILTMDVEYFPGDKRDFSWKFFLHGHVPARRRSCMFLQRYIFVHIHACEQRHLKMWRQAGVSNVLLAIQACDTSHSLSASPHNTLLGHRLNIPKYQKTTCIAL